MAVSTAWSGMQATRCLAAPLRVVLQPLLGFQAAQGRGAAPTRGVGACGAPSRRLFLACRRAYSVEAYGDGAFALMGADGKLVAKFRNRADAEEYAAELAAAEPAAPAPAPAPAAAPAPVPAPAAESGKDTAPEVEVAVEVISAERLPALQRACAEASQLWDTEPLECNSGVNRESEGSVVYDVRETTTGHSYKVRFSKEWPPTCTCDGYKSKPQLRCKHMCYLLVKCGVPYAAVSSSSWDPTKQEVFGIFDHMKGRWSPIQLTSE